MAKAKILPSGRARVRVFVGYKYVDGKKTPDYVSVTKDTPEEAEYEAYKLKQRYQDVSRDSTKMTLEEAIEKYIAISSNRLSPSTIDGYQKVKKYAFQNIMHLPIHKITVALLNEEINNEMGKYKTLNNGNASQSKLSPKTIINRFGLISAVLNQYYPDLNLRGVKLPEKKKAVRSVLPPEIIFDIVRGNVIELPVLLAVWLSFSISEIRALTKSKSIVGNDIIIRDAVVDVNGTPMSTGRTKEYNRARKHRIPEYIQQLINQVETDELVTLSGQAIYKRWSRLLQKNNLPHMSFHDLRHVNASIMMDIGIPDKYAKDRGGWKTDSVYKTVYQFSYSKTRERVDDQIDAYFKEFVKDSEPPL